MKRKPLILPRNPLAAAPLKRVVLMEAGRWVAPPSERPAGWRTDPKYAGVREK